MTRLLCVGLATVDLVYRVDRMPGVDEKAQALDLEIAAGGPAANAAVTAAALGAQVTLVTAIGAHPLGELIRADLQAHSVRVADASPQASSPPPVSAVTVLGATGERTIVSRNAGDAAVRVPDAGLPDADLTLVDGHHPALAVAAARSARRLLVDAGSWRPVFADLLPHAEVVACSAAFRHPAQQSPTDESMAAAIPAPHVIVTHGPDPVRWFSRRPDGDPGPAGEVPVPPVAAVDTAGAGDAFHGALAVALAHSPTDRPPTDRPPTDRPPTDRPPAADRLPPTLDPPQKPDESDLSGAIGFAVWVAGIRVVHPGPRSWLAALKAQA